MTILRKALPLLVLCALFAGLLSAQAQNDCTLFTTVVTGDANGQTVANLSQNAPCVNWRVTFSVTGTLSTSVTFQTSPNGTVWTAVPNTLCAAAVQPPCIFQGSNPATGTQGTAAISAYGAYIRVITSGSSGTGTATIRVYGAKGITASASQQPSNPGTVTTVSFTGGIISVANPTTAPAFTVAGTSGGIVYFSSATTWASSGVLTANGVVLGGGAGATPTVTAADSTTTHALFATAGAPAFRALAFSDLPAGTASGTGTLNVLPRWSNTTGGLVDSAVTDNGTNILIARPTLVNTTVDLGAMLTVLDTRNTSPRGILSWQTSTDTESARVGFAKARGTASAPSTVVTGDALGRLMFRGYDGTNYLEMASIQAVSTGTIGTGRVPTYMAFMTATDNATSVLTEAMRITAAQTVNIGGLATTAYGLDVSRGVGLTGTARFFDQTATTGSTLVTITPGAAQTSASTVLSLGGAEVISGPLQFGGITSSFAAIFGSGTSLLVRLADNSLPASFSAGNVTVTAAGELNWSTRATERSPADGVITLLNAAESGFTRIQFGGTSSSFAGIGNTNQANPIVSIVDAAGGPTAQLAIPFIQSTTGQRYVCVTTTGILVSSAVACVGT